MGVDLIRPWTERRLQIEPRWNSHQIWHGPSQELLKFWSRQSDSLPPSISPPTFFASNFDVDCHCHDSYIFLLCLGSCALVVVQKWSLANARNDQYRPVVFRLLSAVGIAIWFFHQHLHRFYSTILIFIIFLNINKSNIVRMPELLISHGNLALKTEATVAVWTLRTFWQKGRALARKMRSHERRRCQRRPAEWLDMCGIWASRGSSWNMDYYLNHDKYGNMEHTGRCWYDYDWHENMRHGDHSGFGVYFTSESLNPEEERKTKGKAEPKRLDLRWSRGSLCSYIIPKHPKTHVIIYNDPDISYICSYIIPKI